MAQPRTTIGLLAAILDEIGHFQDSFVETKRHEIAGFLFREGSIDGRPVFIGECGIGKVNAATAATILIDRFRCGALVVSGAAGGVDPDLGVGDVVVARRLVQHDYGAVVDGMIKTYQPGVLPVPGCDEGYGWDMPAPLEQRLREGLSNLKLPWLSAKATGEGPRMPRVVFGTVLSGDIYVNCDQTREHLYTAFGGQAIEMEGAAIAQVAARFNVPVVVVRAISDDAGDESHRDFAAFQRETADIASCVTRRIVQTL